MDAENWSFADAVTWWLRLHGPRFASLRDIRRRLRLHVLPELGQFPCAEVTGETLEGLLNGLQGRLGAHALNHLRSDVRRVVRAAQASRHWPWGDPTLFVRHRKPPRRAWRTLTADECRALLFGAEPQHLALFATALYTGLRRGELVALQVDDVDLMTRRLYVRRSGRRSTTKTGVERIVPICTELALYLSLQIEVLREVGCRWLFPGRDLGQRTDSANFARAARVALVRGGGSGTRLRFHDLRHTFSTRLRRARVDPAIVGLLMGHAGGRSSTDGYTHFNEEDLMNAVSTLALGAPRRMHP